MISEKNYLDLMVPFYDFVKKQCRKSDNGLSYYGTGESAHWAIQSNYNVAGALAVMAETACEIPLDKDELREKALELFRYNLHTHVTGEKKMFQRSSVGRFVDHRSGIGTDGRRAAGSGKIFFCRRSGAVPKLADL